MPRSPARHRRLTLETLCDRRVLENHAPVLDNSGQPTMPPTYFEGTRVADFASAIVSDSDPDSLFGIGVIATSPQTDGIWERSIDGGVTWQRLFENQYGKALVLRFEDYVRFLPSKPNPGNLPTLSFRAWDQSNGTAPGRRATVIGQIGSSGAFSEAVETAQMSLSPSPEIIMSGTCNYRRNDPPIILAPQALVYDGTDTFAGGSLEVRLTPTGAMNRLWLGGPAVVDGVQVSLDGAVIGEVTSNGIGENSLKVVLNSNATLAGVQRLVRSITYQNIGGSFGKRTVEFILDDGQGGTNVPTGKMLSVSLNGDAPGILLNVVEANYQLGAPPMAIARQASVTDMGGTGHASGKLTVAVSPIGAHNRVWIGGPLVVRPEYIISDGIGTRPLEIALPQGTTAAAVEQLIRSVTYQNVGGSVGKRTITFTYRNNASETSLPATMTLNVISASPVLTLSGALSYQRNAPAVALAPNAEVSDIDSPNFGGGSLRVWITTGGGTNNTLAIGSGFTVDSSGNVKQGTLIIGKRLSNGIGTNELRVQFNSNATVARVQALVRAITYRNAGGSAGPRTIAFTVSDGDGGVSDVRTKTVNVT
jgi:hypothetical protein